MSTPISTRTPPSSHSHPIRRGVAQLRSGVRLSYAERGPVAETALVLLPGLSDSWRSYEPLLAQLPPTLRVIAVSQRGHGDSERPEAGYLLADFASDLRELLAELSIEAALVVGHSLGASVALRFARDCPERALGLALIGAFADYRHNPGILELQAVVSQLTDPVDRAFIRDFQQATLARPVRAELLELVVSESRALPARVWKAVVAGLVSPAGVVPLQQIRVPTLLLWGERDAFARREDQQRLLAGIPGARLVEFGGGGHACHWEEPAESARELAGFAARLAVSGAGLAREGDQQGAAASKG